MSSVPPGLSPLRLPRGEIVFYPSGRPSIRLLTLEIATPPSGGLALCCGPWRDHFIYCRSHGAVGVRFVFGPERLRFFPQRARLRQRRSRLSRERLLVLLALGA